MSQQELELRIYTGLHAGAKATLVASNKPTTIGHDPTNDVILRDAGFATAQIILEQEDWRWVFADASHNIPRGACVQIADLVIGVDYLDALWPKDGQFKISHKQSLQAEASLASQASLQVSPSQDLLTAEETLSTSTTDTPVFLHPAKQRRRLTKPQWAALVSLVCLLLGVLWLQGSPTQAPESLSKPSIPSVTTLPQSNDQLAELQRVIQLVGYGKQVRVVAKPEGKYQLQGVVANEAQMDELLKAASTITRRILPSVLTQNEFAARLKSIEPQLPQWVTVKAFAVGIVGIKADASKSDALAQLKDLIQRELPEMVAFEVAAAEEEPPPLTAEEGGQKRQLKARILPSVAAIQSGPNSYILLTNGRKVMPGGNLENHKLLSIEDSALVLQDKAGQMVRITR